MKALTLIEPQRVEVVDRAVPEPGVNALVSVDRGGICGSDVKIVGGQTAVRYPRILGHELVGTVVAAARDERIPTGTRVLVNPFASCGHCVPCRADRANLCATGSLMGREVDGGFAEMVVVEEDRLLPVPAALTRDAAAMSQVLGVCVHGQARISAFPGQTAAVVGLGVGGFLHTQLLRARGIRQIIGITGSARKRALAEQLGASITCNPDEAEACVADVTAGHGADVVVECVGTVPTFDQAVRLAGAGATVLAYGTTRENHGTFDFVQIYQKELNVVGTRAALARDYIAGMELLAAGAVTVEPLVSTVFPLERGAEAFSAVQARSDLIKVLIEVA